MLKGIVGDFQSFLITLPLQKKEDIGVLNFISYTVKTLNQKHKILECW